MTSRGHGASRFRSSARVGRDPELIDAALHAARRFYRLRDFRAAFDELRPALSAGQLDPTAPSSPDLVAAYAQAFSLSAVILWSTGQREDALGEAERALERFAAVDRDELTNLQRGDYGVAMSIMERHDEARRLLEPVAATGNATPEVYRHLGLSLAALGDRAGAQQQLEDALARAPRDVDARRALAELESENTGSAAESLVRAAELVLGRDPAEALDLADRALTLEPDFTYAETVRAQALVALGRFDEAVGAAELARDADDRDFGTWLTLGQAYRAAGDPNAEPTLQRALELANDEPYISPDDIAAIIGELAQTAAQQGDFDGALARLDQGLAMATGDIRYRLSDAAEGALEMTKASVLNAQGEFKVARVSAIRAISLLDSESPEQAYAYAVLGTSLRMLGEFDDAVSHLRRALSLNPSLVWAHADLGEALRGRGDFTEAIGEYGAYLAKVGDEAWIYRSLATSLAGLGDLAGAVEPLERSIELDGADPLTWEMRGRLLANMHPEEAVASFERAMELDPAGFGAYDGYAEALRLAGRFEEALAAIERALDPWNPSSWALATRGQIRIGLGQRDAGVEDILQALSRPDADVPWAHRDLGDAYLTSGESESALEHYDTFLATYPDDVSARLGRIRARIQVGPIPEIAEEIVAEIDTLDDPIRMSIGYSELGNQARLAGEYEEALRYLDRALSLDPDAWTLGTKARTLLAQGEIEHALAAYQEAVAFDDAAEWVHAEYGEQLRLKGEFEAALEHLDRGVELNPEYAWGFAARASAHRDMGNPGLAIDDLDRAIELDPQYGWAFSERGKLKLRLGHDADGEADIDASLALLDTATLNDLGFEYLDSRPGLAIRIFDRALARSDATVDTFRGKAFALAGQEEIELATQILEGELDKDSNEAVWSTLHVDLGRIYLLSKDYLAAAKALGKASERPDDPWFLTNAAILLLACGLIEQSEPLIRRAVDVDSTNAHAHQLLGTVHEHAGEDRAEEALEHYARSLDLDPTSDWAAIGVATMLLWMDRDHDDQGRTPHDLLSPVIEKAWTEFSNTDALSAGGWAAIVDGSPGDAVSILRDAVAVDDDLIGEQFDLGLALALDGKDDRAIREYETGIELSALGHIDPLRRNGLLTIARSDLEQFGSDLSVSDSVMPLLDDALEANLPAFEEHRGLLEALLAGIATDDE